MTLAGQPQQLLRAGLLEHSRVLLARAPGSGADLATAVADSCAGLGAVVLECVPLGGAPAGALEEHAIEAEVEGLLGAAGGLETVVVDAAGLYAALRGAAGAGEEAERIALAACMQASWSVVRAVAGRAFIAPAEADSDGGQVLLITPPPGAGAHAAGVRAGIENLARTLSTEWARHRVTAVAIAAGEASTPAEVGELVAYLISPAGRYFSGCRLDLGGLR